MALRAYTGLRPCRGRLTLPHSIFRQSAPAAVPPSRLRTLETSAQVYVAQASIRDRAQRDDLCQTGNTLPAQRLQGAQTKEAKNTRSKYKLEKAAGKSRYEVAPGQRIAVSRILIKLWLTDTAEAHATLCFTLSIHAYFTAL